MKKSNLHFPAVPPIQTAKGQVVFFRTGRSRGSDNRKGGGIALLPEILQRIRSGTISSTPG